MTQHPQAGQAAGRALRAAGWGLAALLLYAAAVARPVTALVRGADAAGCIDPHALDYGVLVLAGTLGGLGAGPLLEPGIAGAARALVPRGQEAAARRLARTAAVLAVLVAMAGQLWWISPVVNAFVDAHRVLLVETEVSLFAMGVLNGTAWVMLWRRAAWLGLVVTAGAGFMVMSSVLNAHGWC